MAGGQSRTTEAGNTPSAGRSEAFGPTAGIPGTLFGVSMVPGTNHVWAVGGYGVTILHWNGSSWSKMSSPTPPEGICYLQAVSAVSQTSAWAVGAYYDKVQYGDEALTLHWNGNRWFQIPNPGIGGVDGYSCVYGVTTVPGTDHAWAVGSGSNEIGNPDCPGFPAILRWDGSVWRSVLTPYACYGSLHSVSATSDSNAWAVGNYGILHWNGVWWTKVADGKFSGVSADSTKDAWAVGGSTILHWNGVAWSQVPAPAGINLNAVTAMSPTSAWAVGAHVPRRGIAIEHWNGRNWSVVTTPRVGRGVLYGVSANPVTHRAWAVGEAGAISGEGGGRVLILYWNGTRWYPSPA